MKAALVILLACSFLYAEEIRFQKRQIDLGSRSLTVEMATTEKEQMRGLMFRKKLGENEGMLFVYSNEQPRSFWMKNTLIPLSIGFFDKNRKLVDIQEMSPVASEIQIKVPTYQSRVPAMYALEVSPGWFKKNKVNIGSIFKFQSRKD